MKDAVIKVQKGGYTYNNNSFVAEDNIALEFTIVDSIVVSGNTRYLVKDAKNQIALVVPTSIVSITLPS